MLAGLATLMYSVGIVLDQAERNWLAGIVSALGLLVGDLAMFVLLGATTLIAILSVVYSYYCYRQLKSTGGAVAPS